MQHRVAADSGADLEPEVRIVGFEQLPSERGGHTTMNTMTTEGAVSLDAEGHSPQSPTMETCDLLAGTPYAELPEDPAVEVDPRFAARLDDVGASSAAATAGALHWRSPRLPSPHSSAWWPHQVCRGTPHRRGGHRAPRRRRGAAGLGRARRAVDAAARHRCGRPARVERLPWVADAQVSISWPNTLVIHVTEWEPVAYTADHGRWALLASNGRVLDEVLARPTAYMKVVGLTTVPAGGHTITGGSAVDTITGCPTIYAVRWWVSTSAAGE